MLILALIGAYYLFLVSKYLYSSAAQATAEERARREKAEAAARKEAERAERLRHREQAAAARERQREQKQTEKERRDRQAAELAREELEHRRALRDLYARQVRQLEDEASGAGEKQRAAINRKIAAIDEKQFKNDLQIMKLYNKIRTE